MGLSAMFLELRCADNVGMSKETQFTIDQLDTLVQNLIAITWRLEQQGRELDDHRYLPVRVEALAAN
jgi:hypothetical protein